MKRFLLNVINLVVAGVAWLVAAVIMLLPWRLRCWLTRALMALVDFALQSRVILRLAVRTRWRS